MAVNGNGVEKSLRVKVVLLDIEGTTTAITFVKEKLFPYASEQLESYLRDHWGEEECENDVDQLREQYKADKQDDSKQGVPNIPEKDSATKEELIAAVVANVKWLMAADRKVAALKTLQGHIWRHGYAKEELLGHVYSDVVGSLKLWTEKHLKVCIYSSGSVEAQKLLFGHSESGDLLKYISGHFDTNTGHKRQVTSYKKIASALDTDPQDIVFLTDIAEEAKAAQEAGMQVIILTRPNNAPLTEQDKELYRTISSFTELDLTLAQDALTTPSKKAKLS